MLVQREGGEKKMIVIMDRNNAPPSLCGGAALMQAGDLH